MLVSVPVQCVCACALVCVCWEQGGEKMYSKFLKFNDSYHNIKIDIFKKMR